MSFDDWLSTIFFIVIAIVFLLPAVIGFTASFIHDAYRIIRRIVLFPRRIIRRRRYYQERGKRLAAQRAFVGPPPPPPSWPDSSYNALTWHRVSESVEKRPPGTIPVYVSAHGQHYHYYRDCLSIVNIPDNRLVYVDFRDAKKEGKSPCKHCGYRVRQDRETWEEIKRICAERKQPLSS